MESFEQARRWLDSHRAVWLDLLRIYMGFALFVKGVAFVRQGTTLVESVRQTQIGLGEGLVANYVLVAHLAGGLLLGIGLFTRFGAAIQIPVLAGAALLVHRVDGFFAPPMTLEFTILVLALLILFTAAGGGPLSVDAWLHKRHAGAMPPSAAPTR